jgi:hypothetical protein
MIVHGIIVQHCSRPQLLRCNVYSVFPSVDTLSSCPNSVSKQCAMIDRLGVLSGIDQKLKGPITSVDMLKDSDHILFVHIQKSEALNTEEVITGYLKVGYKRLYFYVSSTC